MKLRPGIRILLVLALVFFALIVGIGSAALEISTLTQVQIDSAVNRAKLAGHIVFSQLAITLRDSSGTAEEAIRSDARLATVIADARELTPAVSYILVADTTNRVLIHSDPALTDSVILPKPPLLAPEGFNASIRQFSSMLKESGNYELAIPLDLYGRPFGSVRVGIAAVLVREDLLSVFRTDLLKIVVQVLLAIVLGLLVSWSSILRPLARIEKGLEHLRRGDFSHRLAVDPTTELGQIASLINQLGEALAREHESFANQRESLVSEGNALRSIVNAVDDGLLMIDRNRQIIMSNQRASAILGVKFSEFAGKPLSTALAKNHPLVKLVEKSFDENRPESAQIELKSDHGNSVFLASSQVVGESSHQQGAIISLREYGRMREIQEMLDHARVLARLGKMAAGVAHEVRNPLNAMVLHVELIRTRLEMEQLGKENGGRKLHEHLNVVSKEIARLERVVSGFLKLTRLQELQLTAIEVPPFLNELKQLVLPEARMAGVDIEIEVQDNVPHIYGDEEVLRQAFLNLLKNAVQASPPGSESIRLSAESDGAVVQMSVEDRGQGIPPELQSRVFDLYYTTKKEGTGVGLSQAQQAIEMHGGTITLTSKPDVGTVFRIRLPALTTA
jgi:PAS domain S-box-containing protein